MKTLLILLVLILCGCNYNRIEIGPKTFNKISSLCPNGTYKLTINFNTRISNILCKDLIDHDFNIEILHD